MESIVLTDRVQSRWDARPAARRGMVRLMAAWIIAASVPGRRSWSPEATGTRAATRVIRRGGGGCHDFARGARRRRSRRAERAGQRPSRADPPRRSWHHRARPHRGTPRSPRPFRNSGPSRRTHPVVRVGSSIALRGAEPVEPAPTAGGHPAPEKTAAPRASIERTGAAPEPSVRTESADDILAGVGRFCRWPLADGPSRTTTGKNSPPRTARPSPRPRRSAGWCRRRLPRRRGTARNARSRRVPTRA